MKRLRCCIWYLPISLQSPNAAAAPWLVFWCLFPSCGVQAVSGSVLVMGLRDGLCSSHPPILRGDKVAC